MGKRRALLRISHVPRGSGRPPLGEEESPHPIDRCDRALLKISHVPRGTDAVPHETVKTTLGQGCRNQQDVARLDVGKVAEHARISIEDPRNDVGVDDILHGRSGTWRLECWRANRASSSSPVSPSQRPISRNASAAVRPGGRTGGTARTSTVKPSSSLTRTDCVGSRLSAWIASSRRSGWLTRQSIAGSEARFPPYSPTSRRLAARAVNAPEDRLLRSKRRATSPR